MEQNAHVDLQTAKQALTGHSIALCKGNRVLTSDKRGIAPMMDWIAEGKDLCGYAAADCVVGKAAAFLFVKAGIASVFAATLSEKAKTVLQEYGIPCSYDVLVPYIVNREDTDMCPMEKAVQDTNDPALAYVRLLNKIQELRA